jgi:hypothetical protein
LREFLSNSGLAYVNAVVPVNHVCLLFSLKLMVWQADVVEPMRLCTTLIRLLRQKTEAVPSCVRLVIGLSIDTLLVSENN